MGSGTILDGILRWKRVEVDRGKRELPIQPDFVGLQSPGDGEDAVNVKLVEVDGVDEVELE